DGDGLLDAYFVNGAPLPGSEQTTPPENRLYRNLGDGTFADVTLTAGVGDTGYGLGCGVADIDNDGDSDLFITNYGPNALYRNDGDGTFTDITGEAGVGHAGFSAGSAFADFDSDGFVDLFVANYVDLDLESRPECHQGGIRAYCRPEDYPATLDALYRNNGDGTFSDVSEAAGITKRGRGLGVVWSDFDGDGLADIYVANDRMANFLYRNRGDESFEEIGEVSGAAYNEHGYSESGMGVATGDFDGDGATDLFVTNYQAQTNTLYRNEGPLGFWDVTDRAGLGESSLLTLAWGAEFADLDNDGLLDLFVANGHLEPDIAAFEEVGEYRQTNQTYRNVGNGRLLDVSEDAGAGLAIARSSRGLAMGDVDNDGDMDALVGNIGEAPDLLRNDSNVGAAWIGITLVGVESSRDGIGARIDVTAGGRTQTRAIRSGGSYLSRSDPRALFGLGDADVVDELTVRWPSGVVDRLGKVAARSYIEIREGQ
ncbi:CRTAC1 family protein, partial [Candidatus Poribacteria bacterium]|nr:CRTAC1 family protein [Candidatus Poribacteria bacterium]